MSRRRSREIYHTDSTNAKPGPFVFGETAETVDVMDA